jgi:beta-galactosidase
MWEVPWEKGEIVAVGRDRNGDEHRSRLVTPEAAGALKLTADRNELRGDGRDAIHVTIELVDGMANRASRDDREITVRTEGGLALVALENGDLSDNSPPKSAVRRTRGGRALAIFQAKGSGAPARVTVEAEGLEPVTADIRITP